MAKAWLIWFYESLVPRVQGAPESVLLPAASLIENQSAAIATTPLPIGDLPAGDYLVSYNARKTTADGAASSLTVTIGWTDIDGTSQIMSGAAMAVDNTITPQSNTWIVSIANSSPITYATLYSSTTPGNMKYKLEVLVQRL